MKTQRASRKPNGLRLATGVLSMKKNTGSIFQKLVLFSLLGTICFAFSGCIPDSAAPVKEIPYGTPTIFDEDLDIGLFSPFEVPLVQNREYEFTATTSHKYIRVHFVIPNEGDKWISLRKIESNIFSQNLIIPKGTEKVEIGISDRANAKDSNDVKIYAAYDVITLEEFKDVIEDEERRRESENVPSKEQPEVLRFSEKISIDHKYTSRYPKALKRGETYTFEIGPFDSSYCILNAVNKHNFQWLPVERNKSKYFKINYQIPSDAEEFRIVLSSTSTSFTESLVSFNLVGEIDESKSNKLENGENIVISSATMSSLKIPVDDEKIYSMSVDSFGSNYKYCHVYFLDSNSENLDSFVLDRNKITGKYETKCLYVPNGTKRIDVYLSDDYFSYTNKIADIIVEDRKTENPLKAGPSIQKADKYRTDSADKDLGEFLESRNIETFSPDEIVDLCVNYIEENALDDYHKIKLVHDCIWYLASYDHDSLEIGNYWPWDFRTVLSRRLCVCAGFSRTFVYFCEKLGIRAINVLGNALDGTERTAEEVEDQDHAWTILELNDGWYLFDLTWDCSITHGGKRDDTYSCNYFFVRPDDFIRRHYPKNPEKQLLENPYTSNEIVKLFTDSRE